MKPRRLFADYDLSGVIESNRMRIRDLVAAIPLARMVNENFEELTYEIVENIRINPIVLKEDEISYEQTEVKVDVSGDPMRHILDRSQPFYVNGIKVSYFVPFEGDPQLLQCQPSSFTMMWPHAIVGKNELIYEFSITDGNIVTTKGYFRRELDLTKKYLGWIDDQLGDYNSGISASVRPLLESRLAILDKSQSQTAELGFKVRERPTAEPLKTNLPARRSTRTKAAPVVMQNTWVKYDVALSFAGENRDYVDEVANHLKDAGVAVFYDKFETVDLWGKNLVDHLGEIYSKSSRFIVMFISEHYAVKSWPNHERKSAQDRVLKMQEDCILPVRFDDSEIPGMPSSIGFINATATSAKELSELIIKKISEK